MNQSIYTTALEYGHKNFFKGIKYSDLKDHIEVTHKQKFDYHSERAFLDWFYEAFMSTQNLRTNSQLIHNINNCLMVDHLGRDIDVSTSRSSVEKFKYDFKFYLSGESDRKYLEYQELQEARKNARQAFILALGAILISVAAVIVSPLIEYYFNFYLRPML